MSETTNKKTNWLVEALAGFAVIYFATHWRQCSWFGGQDERKALTEMAEKLKNEGKVPKKPGMIWTRWRSILICSNNSFYVI